MPPKPRSQGKRKPPPSKGDDRRNLLLLAIGGVALLAIAAVALAFTLGGGGSGGGGGGDARAALEAAGCTVTVKPAVANESDHSDFPDPDARSPKWNTDPPTSGPHYGQTVIYGVYTDPPQIGRLVHNLEHGAAYILYGDGVSAATVQKLRDFYDDHTRGTVLAPYPRLGGKIALGAWVDPGLDEAKSNRGSGVLATCGSFDENAFDAFLAAYQFKGPERFPADSLLPGGG
jgi:hypothetical protein